MVDKRKVISEFYNLIRPDLENFIDYLPMLVADNEDDRRLLYLAWDMVKSLKNDIENAESISELSNTLDVSSIVEELPYIKSKIASCEPNLDLIKDRIMEEFGIYDDIKT